MGLLPRLVYRVGQIPIVQTVLRRAARFYREGSVATIPFGQAKDLKWKRYHRLLSGFWLGVYEPRVQDEIAQWLRPGRVFYDVGAWKPRCAYCSLGAGIDTCL